MLELVTHLKFLFRMLGWTLVSGHSCRGLRFLYASNALLCPHYQPCHFHLPRLQNFRSIQITAGRAFEMDSASTSIPSARDLKRKVDSPAPANAPSSKHARVVDDRSTPDHSSPSAAEKAVNADTSEDVDMESGSESKGTSKGRKSNQKRQQKGRNIKGKGWARISRKEQDSDLGKRKEMLDADGQPLPKAPRYPKRQCALLIGFCGSGYNGMQMCVRVNLANQISSLLRISQPQGLGLKTIEGVLFDALVKVGAVSRDNSDNPVKVRSGPIQVS